MKIIFLDVDGVLNWMGTEERFHGFTGIDASRVAQFNRIYAAHPDAKIVVSSTWRKGMSGVYDGLDGIAGVLRDHGVKGEVISMTPVRFSRMERGSEIREWIQDFRTDHPDVTLTYVILDDDDSAMAGGSFERYLGKSEDGEDQYDTEVLEDLRPYHVVTTYYGEQYQYLAKNGDADVLTSEEGGLQDRHVEQAIRILNGEAKS